MGSVTCRYTIEYEYVNGLFEGKGKGELPRPLPAPGQKVDSHAGEVPEGEHEAVLLVVHVDRLGDTLLAFGARVDVQSGGEDHERHVLSRVEDKDTVRMASEQRADARTEDVQG